MSAFRNRRGSALLIVLGMLAFMVVSAVAFSAFMRTSRLPSSYLRRVVSSKLLVKGALANAIDEIDAAVGNFPHPGVWNDYTSLSADLNIGKGTLPNGAASSRYISRMSALTPKIGRDFHNYNSWLGRVYIGGTNVTDTVQNQLLPQHKTVSTLCLEALAYLPPPLVNEARYYSRHSRAGTWHTMGFDAGRYAFCAVDVSDYFDINRLYAGYGRNSTPEKRISLSYLFENTSHGQAASGSKGWDSFIQGYIDQGVPLISLADWNLALGSRTFGMGIKSYFYNYATQGADGSFYGRDGETVESVEAIQRMAFVTDSWFPESHEVSDGEEFDIPFDLTKEEDQPFDPAELQKESRNVSVQRIWEMNGSRDALKSGGRSAGGVKQGPGLRRSLGFHGFVSLWDYLDKDSVPVSLALPTVERTPMVAAINILGDLQNGRSIDVEHEITNKETVPEKMPEVATEADTFHTKYTVRYSITLPSGYIKPVLVYPFRNIPETCPQEFEVAGRLSYFMTAVDSDLALRTSNSSDSLHLGKNLNNDLPDPQKGGIVNDSVYVMPLRKNDLNVKAKFKYDRNGQNALVSDDFTLQAVPMTAIPFLEVTYEWDSPYQLAPETKKVLGLQKENPEAGDTVDVKCLFQPMQFTKGGGAGSGVASSAFSPGKLLEMLQGSGGDPILLRLHVAANVWVKERERDEVVDLVPATFADDTTLFGKSVFALYNEQFSGRVGALLRFDAITDEGDAIIDIDPSGVANQTVVRANSSSPVKLAKSAAMCADPRYNYAPECWFTLDTPVDPASWLANCRCRGSAEDGNRDGDILMQTSDQCWLQSVYELANLPRLTEFYVAKGGDPEQRGGYAIVNDREELPASFAQTDLRDFAWRTYNPFPGTYRDAGDDFDHAGFTSAGSGFKVNPYSDNTNIVMAAFANTPLEWTYAADHELSGLPSPEWASYDDSGFNGRFAWNDIVDPDKTGRIRWSSLQDLAGTFMHEMRVNDTGDWQDAFANLYWYNQQFTYDGTASQYLLAEYRDENGATLAPSAESDPLYQIYNCDRKFLYGFWHDCFAVKQQLYLIFVRAEPMLMGGGAIHQSPPALGTRAVALVWRDPVDRSRNPQMNDYGSEVQPHRTRVLFYRQFD